MNLTKKKTCSSPLLLLYAISFIMFCCFSVAIAQPQTILFEDFNACTLSNAWENTAVTNTYTWTIGQDTSNWTVSMNNSCMAFFNDDALGQTANPLNAMLVSPAFDGTQNARIMFEVDFHFRSYQSSSLSFMVFDGVNYRLIKKYIGQSYTGNTYSDYEHASIDISAYRATNNRIAIVYDDGDSWAWWAAIDNFKITGEGTLNDDCSRAQMLNLNMPCDSSYTNINALFTGEMPSCIESSDAGVWFTFQAPLSGTANIVTNADFNEIITVFSGDCNSLNQIACTNFDEFGFTSETMRLSNLEGGQYYYARVSGATNTFGITEGNFCIEIQSPDIAAIEPPANDDCSNAIMLDLNNTCINGTNRGATLSPIEPIPSRNNRSRASVWYTFIVPADTAILIENDADFADVLTVYSGNHCDSLIEIAGNEYGRTLQLNNLIANTLYHIQISSYFATIEGDFCIRAKTVPPAPDNEVCTQAIPLSINGECVTANNKNAHFVENLSTIISPFQTYSANTLTGNYYTRPHQDAVCTLSDRTPQYDFFTFMVDSTAVYEIINTYSPGFDGYLHLYADTFDPQNPCATYIAGNDDYNGDIGYSYISDTLTAGTLYYIVSSAWQTHQTGDYNTAITGPGNISSVRQNANIGGMATTCDYKPDAPIWFSFVAPESGKVRIATHTDFPHLLSLYSGICGSLHEVSCAYNPSPCDDAPLFTDLEANQTYFVQIASASTPFGYSYGNVCISVKEVAANPIRVKVKAFLEGAYQGNGTMNTNLQTHYLISEQQPYYTAPWFYNGEECAEVVNTEVVDWVIVELRDPIDPSILIAQKAAMLNNKGNIIDRNKDAIYFDAPIGDYYIAIRHRNHLAVMSAVPVPLPNVNTYNFATGVEYAFGNEQLKNMGDGNYALYAGDANANGVITVSDFNIFMEQSAQLNNYVSGDLNLDRAVSVADFNIYQLNASKMAIPILRH